MPTFRHAAAASRQRSGGSSSETNSPPPDAEDRVRRDQASAAGPRRGRSRSASSSGVRFVDAERQSVQPLRDLDGRHLDDSLDGLLLADQDADDLPARPAQRLRPPPAREREGPAHAGRADEFAQRHLAEGDLALLRLLPGLEEPVADPERLDGAERRLLVRPASRRAAGRSSPTLPGRQVQEADDRLERRRRRPADQALGLVARGVAAVRRPAVRLGVEAAERPALAVLDRRPIGVEDVPFVQDGVGDGVDERAVHGVTGSSAAASSRSSACSQVGRPCRLL